jgi:uroporphyrinogen decarboxylase
MVYNVVSNNRNDKRMAIALKMGKPDSVPLEIVNACSFLSGWLGFKPYNYYRNPCFMLECQLKFREMFRGYGMIGPDYGISIEPSSFGAKIVWPDNEPPWALPMINNVNDIPEFIASLGEPDPLMSGYTPLMISTYFYMKEIVGELISPPTGMLGPFDIACLLIGTENVMLGMKIYPDCIHMFLKKITNYIKRSMSARAELFQDNLDIIYLGEDNPGFISDKDFKEFVIPYTGLIFKEMSNPDSIKIWHCDGRLEHLIGLLPELGINALSSFDPWTDISVFKNKIGDRICLMGNIDPIKVLSRMTKEEIENEVKRIIDIGKINGGFILSTGGELCNGVPEENVNIFLDAVEKYGKY